MVVVGTVSLAVGPGAGAAVAPGQGNSYAQLLQVTPHEGSLAVGVVTGEALAGHTNYSARAQSQGVDLGSIGLSLQNYNCGAAPSATQKALVPQPLEVETGQPGAAQGETQTATTGATSTSSTNLPPSFGSTEFVQATATPYGEADTSFAPIDTPVFSVSGMKAKSWSGLVDGQREAGATADIGAIGFVNNTVVLKDLHWETLYPSGGTAQPTGSFSMGSISVAGTGADLPDTSAVVSIVNKVLDTLGIQLVLPAVSSQLGVETVTPLQILVVPNPTRDTVVDSILTPGSTVISPFFSGLENGFGPPEPDQLAQVLCQSDTPITVSDITLASLDGAGFFSAGFGGVHATSSAVPANLFNLSLPGLGGLSTNQFIPGTQSIAGTPATPGTPAVAATAGSTPSVSSSQPAVGSTSSPPATAGPPASTGTPADRVQTVAAVGHAPGGPLLGIGLGGLGLLALLAEGDRRMMRRAQHSTNFDNFEE